MPVIYQANTEQDFELVRLLTREYLTWTVEQAKRLVGKNLNLDAMLGYSLADLEIYTPPKGRLLLALEAEDAAAVVFLKKLREDACEIKRMYVRPEFRGKRIAVSLLEDVISSARRENYCEIYLDSISFMDQAHKLYRAYGFHDIDMYPESEVGAELQEHMLYMKLVL